MTSLINHKEQFRRVFSRLPTDIQRYIREYVPQVFDFIQSFDRLRLNRRISSLQIYVNIPKSTWNRALNVLSDRHAIETISNRSSRQDLCKSIQALYKRLYKYNSEDIIREEDFWTHQPWRGVFRKNVLLTVLEKVEGIIVT
jgi:hypothetical protein